MASSTNEIITLQLGHYSNFVGTHWWNIQSSSFVYETCETAVVKEINNDVLFREGCNLLGEVSYTPRLILLDLKDSLNTLKEDGTLYDIPGISPNIAWSGDVQLQKATSAAKNRFLSEIDDDDERDSDITTAESSNSPPKSKEEDNRIRADDISSSAGAVAGEGSGTVMSNDMTDISVDHSKTSYCLDDNVNVWSDFLYPRLHPRSVFIVDAFQHNNQDCKFDAFGLGIDVYKDHRVRTQLDDRLHFFAEECDHLQGFHVLIDTYNAFGGLAASVLDDIVDDYGNKAITCYAVTPASFPETTQTVQDEQYRVLNAALSYDRVIQQCSMLLPMSAATDIWRTSGPPRDLPYLKYKADLSYHTSAMLGANLDTLTLPYRLLSNAVHMSDLTSAITPVGRKVVALQSSFPLPIHSGSNLVDSLLSDLSNIGQHQLWHSMTPSCNLTGVSPDLQVLVSRGVSEDHVLSQLTSRTMELQSGCTSIDDIIARYAWRKFNITSSAITAIQQTCKVMKPFPQIFDRSVNSDGFISPSNQRPAEKGVEFVPVMTSVECTSGIKGHLDKLLIEAKKLNIRRLHRLTDAGLEADELTETFANLASLSQCYSNEDEIC